MYISNLSIRNFRTFRSVCLDFNKGVNTIIGENGSGKTNLFHALRLLIDESLPKGTRLVESDFTRTLPDWRGHWIIIQIFFNELDPNEEAQAIAMHKVGDASESDTSIGSYSLFFRPREQFRRKLFEYSGEGVKNVAGLQTILDTISINDYELVYRGKANVNLTEDANYKLYVGNFDTFTFPNPDDEASHIYGTKLHGLTIPNEVSCTFAKALRDVEADLRSYRDNPLLNLLRGKEAEIPLPDRQKIEKQVNDLNTNLSALDEVKKISTGISSTIKESVGETYAPGVKIQSELPSEIDKLMQSLKLLVGDPDDPGYHGKIWELSLGGANLIYISLKLLEYERVKAQNRIANFILIEEPEAHIHTHIQKTLFQKLNDKKTQVIISTHSTHISSVSKISSVNVLSRSAKEAVKFSPAKGLNSDQISRLERYLDAVRTNLLFAKGVLLVEGDAEQILIPELIRKTLGMSLDEIGISLINIGSTGFENVAILFHGDRVRKNCSILTDLDASILKLPADPKTDSPAQKDCRNSQISGQQRKASLTAFISGNPFIQVFYSSYTFEVDFLLKGNSHEIGLVVEKEYSREADKKKIKEDLANKDLEVSGVEVLRLASKFGKGWFALMLSEKIDHLTFVPEYIINALMHSSPHIGSGVLFGIGKYRLNQLIAKPFNKDKNDYTKILKDFEGKPTPEESLKFYASTLPSDILTSILKIKGLA